MKAGVLTPAELARQLNTNTGTLNIWRLQRKGPESFRLKDGSVRYSTYAVEKWRYSFPPEGYQDSCWSPPRWALTSRSVGRGEWLEGWRTNIPRTHPSTLRIADSYSATGFDGQGHGVRPKAASVIGADAGVSTRTAERFLERARGLRMLTPTGVLVPIGGEGQQRTAMYALTLPIPGDVEERTPAGVRLSFEELAAWSATVQDLSRPWGESQEHCAPEWAVVSKVSETNY